MTAHEHIDHLLQDYLDGTLLPEERRTVEKHLNVCATCRQEQEALAEVQAAVNALPRSIQPPRDLWAEIEARLTPRPVAHDAVLHSDGQVDRPLVRGSARRTRRIAWPIAAAGLAILLVLGVWFVPQWLRPAWTVARLDGTPRIDAMPLTEQGRLHPGNWLETDAQARAALDVGAIGRVEVGPNTRLQLLTARPTDHRLALKKGRIHARIWAPPRLFFVETPSALAIDLGCEYTLEVDEAGGALLHVTAGYVALEHASRTTVVPAGSLCRTHPRLGPGTPYDEKATAAFADALARLDFDADPGDALNVLLAEARPLDAATLWNLMYRFHGDDRARLYDRLVQLIPPPEGISRKAVLSADPAAIDAWHMHLGLDLDSGWLLQKPKTDRGE